MAEKPASADEKTVAMNEASVLPGVRQHELTDAAETLNEELRAEIAECKRAEIANSLLTSIVESSADSIISITFDTGITSWNKAAEDLYGYRAEEVLGKSLTVLTLPEDLEKVIARIETIKQNKSVDLFETARVHKDGSRLWLAIQLSPVRDVRGEIIGVSTIARNITERKRAEESLRENHQRFRALFELGPVAVYYCDASGVIQEFNHRAAELWGREPAAGETDERFCGSFKLFRPDGSFMPHAQCPMAEVVAGKIPTVYDAEVLIERSDGSRITVVVNIRPLKNERGEITGAVNCFYDITERKQTEQARARLASIVEFSEDAIISKDLNSVITSWNKGAEQLFGYSAQEAIGQSITMLIPPDRFNEEPGILDRIRRGESIEHYETVRRRKDGALLDLSLTVSPVRNDQGQIVGASKIARDITERKRGEEALREAQAQLANHAKQLESLVQLRTANLTRANEMLKSEIAERERAETLLQQHTAKLQETVGELEGFSYGITHDLRAPLRALQGFSAILEEHYSDKLDETGKDFLRRITTSAIRMDKLIQDTLVYSRALRPDLPLEAVDVEKLLRGMLESYPAFQEPKAEVIIESRLPDVLGNEAALTHCFSNLLHNAAKFVAPGTKPRVRISAERRGEKVRFWVADSGIGIDPKYFTNIFGMFQRLDVSFEGTGIGLTIVRKAVERMGGQVGVESEPGQGSRFWLDLKPADKGKS